MTTDAQVWSLDLTTKTVRTIKYSKEQGMKRGVLYIFYPQISTLLKSDLSGKDMLKEILKGDVIGKTDEEDYSCTLKKHPFDQLEIMDCFFRGKKDGKYIAINIYGGCSDYFDYMEISSIHPDTIIVGKRDEDGFKYAPMSEQFHIMGGFFFPVEVWCSDIWPLHRKDDKFAFTNKAGVVISRYFKGSEDLSEEALAIKKVDFREYVIVNKYGYCITESFPEIPYKSRKSYNPKEDEIFFKEQHGGLDYYKHFE